MLSPVPTMLLKGFAKFPYPWQTLKYLLVTGLPARHSPDICAEEYQDERR